MLLSSTRGLVVWDGMFCRTDFEYLGRGTEITVNMFWVACIPAHLLWTQSTTGKSYFSLLICLCVTLLLIPKSVFEAS